MVTRVAMVTFSYYPADVRPRREAEALVEAGMSVDIICLRDDTEAQKEEVNGVCVYRLPLKRKRGRKIRYVWEYSCFTLLTFIKLSILHIGKRYHIVHIHNMPDILVYTALVPRLSGTKIILDLHDPTPEVYMSKYSLRTSNPIIKGLRFLEKGSIRFADLVLTPNIAFRDLFVSRSCPEGKIRVIMNSPQETVFSGADRKSNQARRSNPYGFVLMYHGTIVERNGLDTALEAITSLRDKIPNLVFQVYGDGDFVPRFLRLVEELNLKNIVTYNGFVPLETIAATIPSIDVGIIPNKMSPFTNLNLPTRIFEYLCMGKPVVAPRTRGISDYFDEESLFFFQAGNKDSLADVIIEVYQNHDRRLQVLSRGIDVLHKYRWEYQRQQLVDSLGNLGGNEDPEGSPRRPARK